jgi:hypothetical protein
MTPDNGDTRFNVASIVTPFDFPQRFIVALKKLDGSITDG